MIATLRTIAPFAAALLLAWMGYYLSSHLRLSRGVEHHLEDFYISSGNSSLPLSRAEQLGQKIARRLPLSLEAWEVHLRWVQRGGHYGGWGTGRLVSSSLLYAFIGACLVLANPIPVAMLLPLAAAVYPFISVRAKANTVRRRVVRSLPELATLVAAEMSAGVSPEQAIQRAADIPGPASALLLEVLAASRNKGQPLFSRKPVKGALVEISAQANLPELSAFAAQLDLVAEKGIAGVSLMNEVARTLSREYRSRLDGEVEKLDSRLMLATAVFFFIPFVLIILGSFITPVMALFR
jgi:Flp pilus assembly protein TadB